MEDSPADKKSALAKLTPEERKKVISMAAEMTLTTAILKRRAARQAKLREEQKAERAAKQDPATNSPLKASPKQS